MNKTLEMHVNAGIGPRLVVVGTIIGSIVLSMITFFIHDYAPWYNASASSIVMNTDNVGGKTSVVESTTNDQIFDNQAQCLVSNKFPTNILQWCIEISKYSEEFDISPNLIAAVMLQESGGNPTAYSHSGAVGLMQIMPRDGIAATFMCINGPCFTNRPSISELQDPDFNIEYGTRMLAGLRERHGNIRDALKYYGPMDMGYAYADKVLAIYDLKE